MGPFTTRREKNTFAYLIMQRIASSHLKAVQLTFWLIIYANRFISLVHITIVLRSWQTHNTYIIMIPITEYFSAFSPFERYFIPGVLLLPFDYIFLNGFYNYYLIPIKTLLILLFLQHNNKLLIGTHLSTSSSSCRIRGSQH